MTPFPVYVHKLVQKLGQTLIYLLRLKHPICLCMYLIGLWNLIYDDFVAIWSQKLLFLPGHTVPAKSSVSAGGGFTYWRVPRSGWSTSRGATACKNRRSIFTSSGVMVPILFSVLTTNPPLTQQKFLKGGPKLAGWG